MLKNICVISPDATIAEALKIMVKKKTNSLVVVDKDYKPIGILSSYTLVKGVVPPYLKGDPVYSQFGDEETFSHYANKFKDEKISKFMHTDFHALTEKDTMIEAASYSIKVSRRILPVVDKKGKLVGAITRTCIKNAMYDAIFNKNRSNCLVKRSNKCAIDKSK